MKYKCGCELPHGFDPDINNLRLDCPAVWNLISSGFTGSLFQLESRLGQQWCRKIKPKSVSQLSDVIALLRPGCLESLMEDGKNLTWHYCERKNGREESIPFHPSLKNILSDTFQILIYQEQCIKIAVELAGFSLVEGDLLRKSMGKKLPEEMAKVEKLFLKGCKRKNIVNEKDAQSIFSWIKSAQRYNFNNSHSLGYALSSYTSAFAKVHFPLEFFTAYLYYAKDKPDPKEEINNLVNDARRLSINIRLPDFFKFNTNFSLIDQSIYFGLTDIKGVGKTVYEKIQKIRQEVKNWTQWLFHYGLNLNSGSVENIISVGALNFPLTRNNMLFEFKLAQNLTKREINFILPYLFQDSRTKAKDLCGMVQSTMALENQAIKQKELDIMIDETEQELNDISLKRCIQYLLDSPVGKKGGISNKNRKEKIESLYYLLENPPQSLDDSIEWIADREKELLGVSLTCSSVDEKAELANITCREFLTAMPGLPLSLACELDNIHRIKTKRGKYKGCDMAFLTVSDHSYKLADVIIFPATLEKYDHLLSEGNTVLLRGKKSKNDSFITNEIYQL